MVDLLDLVVLTHDLPEHGLRRGDLGAVVELYGGDALGVEFVAASGRTQALVTLRPDDIRAVADDDLVAVRPAQSTDRSEARRSSCENHSVVGGVEEPRRAPD